uniref:Uncharacterized protein n=1 Tax=Streptomyces avermitilis TaxID=33903 RepID=A0A499W164_STRAX|nr:hypothetical protein SAVMC3_70080 [Streptomyces avermitilis]
MVRGTVSCAAPCGGAPPPGPPSRPPPGPLPRPLPVRRQVPHPYGDQQRHRDGDQESGQSERGRRSAERHAQAAERRAHHVGEADREAAHALDAGELVAAGDAGRKGAHGGHEHGVHGAEENGEQGERPQPGARREQQRGHREDGSAAHRVAADDDPARPEPVGHHSPPSMSRARGTALTAITRPACEGVPAWTAAQDSAR